MKLALHHLRRSRCGATLLEIVISALVMAVLIGAIGQAVMTGSSAYEQGMSSAQIEGQAQRLLERIASEFADVDRSTLTPSFTQPLSASTESFARCTGWNGAGMVVGPTRQIQLAMETGELDNGLDDNGNGLIDECCVILVPDTANPAVDVRLGGYVREFAEGEVPNLADDNGNGLRDERGLSFEHDGSGTLTIRLTLERRASGGRLVDFTVQTAVRMRND